VTVAPGHFQGNGTVAGALGDMQTGATFAPGDSIGVMTFSNGLTLEIGSTSVLELNKQAGTNDSVVVVGGLTFGGTLTVTNLAGTLAPGDSFTLFQADTYTGDFSQTNLPPLPGNLAWVWTSTNGVLSIVGSGPVAYPDSATTPWNVPVTIQPLTNDIADGPSLTLLSVNSTNGTASIVNNGTNVLYTPTRGFSGTTTIDYAITNGAGGTATSVITVTVTIPPKPTITSAVRSGSNLALSGSGGAHNGTYFILSSTNVAASLATWTPVQTNSFDASGNFSTSVPISAARPKNFFLLEQ